MCCSVDAVTINRQYNLTLQNCASFREFLLEDKSKLWSMKCYDILLPEYQHTKLICNYWCAWPAAYGRIRADVRKALHFLESLFISLSFSCDFDIFKMSPDITDCTRWRSVAASQAMIYLSASASVHQCKCEPVMLPYSTCIRSETLH